MLKITDMDRVRARTVIAALLAADAEEAARNLASDDLQASFDAFSLARYSELRQLRKEKEADYGASWRNKGARGILVRMSDKMARLDSLLWKNQTPQVKTESIEDTANDLINYCFFLLYALAEGNLDGPTNGGHSDSQ